MPICIKIIKGAYIIKEKTTFPTYVLVSFFVCLYLFITNFAFAGISVEPVIVEVTASKIAGATNILKVVNTGVNPVKVRVELDKINKSDKDIDTWFTIEPRKITLQPNEEKYFSYSILVPPKESNGELRCMVFWWQMRWEARLVLALGLAYRYMWL